MSDGVKDRYIFSAYVYKNKGKNRCWKGLYAGWFNLWWRSISRDDLNGTTEVLLEHKDVNDDWKAKSEYGELIPGGK